jgi:hypothetical protein
MSAFLKPDRPLWVGSAGWPVLKAAGDQEYSVIRQFAARSGLSRIRRTADICPNSLGGEMKLNYASIVLLSSLAISACAPLQPKLQELQVPPVRIVQNGYSLIPPNEKGWLIVGKSQYQLAFARPGANPDESIAIQAMPFRLPEFNSTEEFVRLIKEGQAKDTPSSRFVISKHEVVAYLKNGVSCAKSHLITEDKAAVNRSGKSGDMILAALTLTCAHPKNRAVGINVTYSHRYYPGREDTAFIEKGTSILDSVEFGDLR